MTPNKPYPEMTDEELRSAYAHWDFRCRQASTWSGAMAQAEAQMNAILEEQARRRSEAP